MKVIHLTWGETPRSYGVFGSQAIKQFVETHNIMPHAEFYFVSAVPIIHSGMIREKANYFNELKIIREMLGQIRFIWLSIWAPQNFVNSSRRTFSWMHGRAQQKLKSIVLDLNPDVIHCRGYHAAWAALVARKESNLRYKIIFDGRGLYPEEVALKRNYKMNDLNYEFLKGIEKKILAECDVSIAVSEPMAEHYRSLGAKKCQTICLSASFNDLGYNENVITKRGGGPHFCYVGALAENTWHRPAALKKLFLRLKSDFPEAKLTIVSTSNHEVIRKIFSEFNESDISIIETRNSIDLKMTLQAADFGLMSYFEPDSDIERMMAGMVMAVKTAEYLCSGLPVIVSRLCGAAASLVTANSMGISYDPFDLESIDIDEIKKYYQNCSIRATIRSKASQLFDYSQHGLDYSILYNHLAN